MSDQITPETDEAQHEGLLRGNPMPTQVVHINFARRLERERDEAREEIKEWKTLCLWGGTPEHIHGFIRGQQSRIQHLERERDEAREAFVIATDQMVIAQGKVREANKERDEARGVLKRIAHASMNARHKEEDYAEWEKAVESLQGICEEKNFINE